MGLVMLKKKEEEETTVGGDGVVLSKFDTVLVIFVLWRPFESRLK
jgi:hypothetical protein